MAFRWEASILGGRNPLVVEVISNRDDELGVGVPTPTCAKEDKESASKAEKNKYLMFLFFKTGTV